jgi:hypothetical protein
MRNLETLETHDDDIQNPAARDAPIEEAGCGGSSSGIRSARAGSSGVRRS